MAEHLAGREFFRHTSEYRYKESDMHSHWAKLASLGIEIKGVTNTMTAMASHMAFLTDQADFDFRFFHRLFLLSDEESVLPFRHRYEKIHFNHTMQGQNQYKPTAPSFLSLYILCSVFRVLSSAADYPQFFSR